MGVAQLHSSMQSTAAPTAAVATAAAAFSKSFEKVVIFLKSGGEGGGMFKNEFFKNQF